MSTILFIAMAAGCDSHRDGSDGGAGLAGGGGTVEVTISGEVLALTGYPFPPASAGDPAFVDGWALSFDELLVTVDKFTLAEDPDRSSTDQSKVGRAVAEVDGPWAVDLHKGGPLAGKGGAGERAVALASLANQNLAGGQPFDPTVRYAFGFDLVAASANAKRVNLDAQGESDYQAMIAHGWTVLYVGTATWMGDASCMSSDPSYDFSTLPKVVRFRLGFATPTTYVNCQNPDNDPARAVGNEEHQRGVQVRTNQATIAQATIHTDHPFWESFVHDSPAHFDQLAALAKRDSSGVYTVTLDDARGVDYLAFRDASGRRLPWRTCRTDLTMYSPPNADPGMTFDSLGIPFDPTGDPTQVMRDYADYLAYDQSTQGHLNSDGLCFVERHFPSPP